MEDDAMPLSPEVREVVRQAAFEMFTRRLTPEELWVEVVRVCRDATTPEEAEAAGLLVGRVSALGELYLKAVTPAPEPPDSAAPAEAAPEPPAEEEAA
jgi:hypothetical protein